MTWIAAHLEWFAYAAVCLSCVALGYALRVTEEAHEAQKARERKCAEIYTPEVKKILGGMFLLLVLTFRVSAQDVSTIPGPIVSVNTSSLTPICRISISSPDGKKHAEIDFCGDKVKYAGDLPVADSARIFFDSVLAEDKGRCEARDKSRVQHMRDLP